MAVLSELLATVRRLQSELSEVKSKQSKLIGGGCTAGAVVTGVSADGTLQCTAGAVQPAISGSCGSGTVATGVGADGSLQCTSSPVQTRVGSSCTGTQSIASIQSVSRGEGRQSGYPFTLRLLAPPPGRNGDLHGDGNQIGQLCGRAGAERL